MNILITKDMDYTHFKTFIFSGVTPPKHKKDTPKKSMSFTFKPL